MQFAIHQHFHRQGWLLKTVPQFFDPTPSDTEQTHTWTLLTQVEMLIPGVISPGSALPIPFSLISPAEEQQTSQVLRSCSPLLRVLYFFTKSELSHKLSILFYSIPPWGHCAPQPEGSVRDLWCRAGIYRLPPHTSHLHLFWSWICLQCHSCLLGNYSRWTDTA